MPATDFQGSSAAASFGRSILSLRRDTVDSQPSPPHVSSITEIELEAFQKQVAERFSLLLCDDLLSLHWMHNLLKAYIACLDDFRFILFNNKSLVNKPPLDRLIHEFFERSVKALDVCNAVRDGIEQIRESNKFVEIVRFALDNSVNKRFLSEGQFRRAKKALVDLSVTFLDDRESGSTPAAQRNRSFGRQCLSSKGQLGNFRSLSWSVSRSWSAARQLQAIGSNLVAPKGNDIVASNGISVAVYTMGSVLLFVMWAMVAAIPCQDRGLQVHFSVPRQFVWAAAIQSLHEKIFEESKKRDRKSACGLLREIYQMGKCTKDLAELIDSVHFPLGEEKEAEIMQRVKELGHVCDSMKECLDPLEKQVRQVFHKIINSRTEVLDCLGRVTHSD